MSKINKINWKGHDVFIEEGKEKEWEQYSRQVKRKFIRDFEKKVAQGRLIGIQDEKGEIIGYVTLEEYIRIKYEEYKERIQSELKQATESESNIPQTQ